MGESNLVFANHTTTGGAIKYVVPLEFLYNYT